MRFVSSLPWRGLLVLVTLVGVLVPARIASGHAFLASSNPEAGATLTELPAAIKLTYSEPVEVGASIFKVYPLTLADDSPAAADEAVGAAAAAERLVDEVLQLRRDEDARADAGVLTTEREAAIVELALKDDLSPGTYVVMWRVLSIDTHITWEHFVFTYASAAE